MQFDRAKHDESFLEFVGIDHGDISADEAFAFESALALVDRRSRQVYFCGEFFCGQPCVVLQAPQNLDVNFVQ